MAKYLSRDLPALEIAWIRFTVFLLLMLPLLLKPGVNVLRSVNPRLQIARSVALVMSSVFFITGLRFLPIAEATSTAFVAPIFVTALSILFLGERVGLRRWVATIVGLLGVVVIVRPGTSAFQPASILPVISAIAWACTMVMTRRISGSDRIMTTMAYAAVTGFVLTSLALPFVWVTPGWREIAIGTAIGLTSTTGHWIVVAAFRHADASVLAPYTYGQLLWVSIFGYFLFSEVPDLWTACGAAIIISSGIYTANRERRRHLKQVEPAEPLPGV